MLPTKHIHAFLLFAGLAGMTIPGCATSFFDTAMLKTAAAETVDHGRTRDRKSRDHAIH